jgi:hypothetical protein
LPEQAKPCPGHFAAGAMGDRPVAGWAASRHLEGTQAIQSTGLPRMAGCHARNNEPRDKALAPLRDLTDETMEQVRRAQC